MQQSIGERLRLARETLRLTAADFADAIGLQGSHHSIYNWEKSKSDVPDKYYDAIHRLGISLTWLLTGNGTMFTEGHSSAQRGARVIGHVMEPNDTDTAEGWEFMKQMMSAAGLELKRHALQLNDHEERLSRIEIAMEDLSNSETTRR